VSTHIAGVDAKNVGGVGGLLGMLYMKIQKADGSGDLSGLLGYGLGNPGAFYTMNVSAMVEEQNLGCGNLRNIS